MFHHSGAVTVGGNQLKKLSLDEANCASCVKLRIRDTEESDATEKLFITPLVQSDTPKKQNQTPLIGAAVDQRLFSSLIFKFTPLATTASNPQTVQKNEAGGRWETSSCVDEGWIL